MTFAYLGGPYCGALHTRFEHTTKIEGGYLSHNGSSTVTHKTYSSVWLGLEDVSQVMFQDSL